VEEFFALRDISFKIESGETIGIIGENGSGKSTLLKLIANIFTPDEGTIKVNGEVASLIELGAGFQPELTGRENIYLNGAILGISKKKMAKRIASIISFSELEQFIDTPVKYYSSGMYMRLAFAIAMEVEPEILLIDEILAVGDEAFQGKCLARIKDFKRRGKTLVIVSHNLDLIEAFSHRVFLLHQGNLRQKGSPREVIEEYKKLLYGESLSQKVQAEQTSSSPGLKGVEIKRVRFLDENHIERRKFLTGEPLIIEINYIAQKRILNPVFGLAIYRADGIHICGPNTKFSDFPIDFLEGEGKVEYQIKTLPLLRGKYLVTVGIFDFSCKHPYDYRDKAWEFEITPGGTQEQYGSFVLPASWTHHRY
jgi:ABC-type polysaccharide/polyol phosphate transport system ATPase subunit